jgi:hypothetical protein
MDRNKILKITLTFSALFGASCSLFSGPSRPEILVSVEELPTPGDYSFITNPQWGPDGNIYFGCWSFSTDTSEYAIFRVNPESKKNDQVAIISSAAFLAVATKGNRMTFSGENATYISDLNACIEDSLEAGLLGRFSTVCDTLYYTYMAKEGLRRYNLNTLEYEIVVHQDYDIFKTHAYPVFDLFPEDSAVLIGDTVFSMTTGDKKALPELGLDYDFYKDCSINPANPRYVALYGLTKFDSLDKYNDPIFTSVQDGIIIVDLSDGSYEVLNALPRNTHNKQYSCAATPRFSPDGNSIIYTVEREGERIGTELAIITNILGD